VRFKFNPYKGYNNKITSYENITIVIILLYLYFTSELD
jgi:hypothetical protein